MRILVLSNLYPPDVIGGYELGCSHVVSELMDRGHDVRVLTSVPREPVDAEPHVHRTLRQPELFHSSRRHLRSPFWELESNLLNSGNVHDLLAEIEAFEPDVCYLWNLVGIGGAGLVGALEFLGVPWLWHLMDCVPLSLAEFDGRVLPLGVYLERTKVGRFLSCSQGLVDEIGRAADIDSLVRLVPNWITGVGGSLDRSYFDGGILRIAFSGILQEQKGVYLLLEAAAHLLEAGYGNFVMDLFGRGPDNGVLMAIDRAGLRGVVRLAGWLPQGELRSRLRQYDVFAFPTWSREPFGFAPLEASAEGCVAVVSTACGYSEWLVDGVHCLKAERTSEAFADTFRRILDGAIPLRPLAERGAAVVRRDFALSAIIPTIEAELATASLRRHSGGTADDAYRLAVIAEALLRSELVE
jgi:glycosyltransferase involved in cell wall biosynthesis